MGKRPKRKVVLFLLEGKSDREVFRDSISELYERIDEEIEVFFKLLNDGSEEEEKGGDITTKRFVDKQGRTNWVTPNNMDEAFHELLFKDFYNTEKVMPKDLIEIVQITDLDGAYIPDECVIEDLSLTKEESPKYTDESVICINADHIVKRNERKRKNIDYLCTITGIKSQTQTIPYSVYYFSTNLDHFLHHNANLRPNMKIPLARNYANGFIGDADGFVQAFSEDPGSRTGMSYDESWDFIKQGKNSLARYTNVNILLDKFLDEGEKSRDE